MCFNYATPHPAGPEDPRLIIWPSKGLFIMFNSKPWPLNPTGTKPTDTQCAGPWAQQPYLMPLSTYTTTQPPPQPPQQQPSQQQQGDPWVQGIIRLQYLPPELQGAGGQAALERLQKAHGGSGPALHKQKNWNPFIYKDQLLFSQVHGVACLGHLHNRFVQWKYEQRHEPERTSCHLD